MLQYEPQIVQICGDAGLSWSHRLAVHPVDSLKSGTTALDPVPLDGTPVHLG